MTEPEFFSPEWAAAVRDALAAGPPGPDRAGKLAMYWDFFDKVKAGYASSWALGCRDLPDGTRAALFIQWGGGTVTDCRVTGPGDQPEATYVLGMDYADWRALHDGYDPQRTVMYRKILVEEGNILEFFKTIYFFTECLAVIGKVPAGFRALAALDRLQMRIGLTGGGATADRSSARPAGPTPSRSPSTLLAGSPSASVPRTRGPIESRLGLSYDTPGLHTDEYVQVLTGLLRGEPVSFAGRQFRIDAGPLPLLDGAEIPVLVGALGSRLLRVAGACTAGTILWMANATAIEAHVAPKIRKAAARLYHAYGELPQLPAHPVAWRDRRTGRGGHRRRRGPRRRADLGPVRGRCHRCLGGPVPGRRRRGRVAVPYRALLAGLARN